VSVFDHYADFEYVLASFQLGFAMLGMGALLAPRDLLEVVRRPRSLAVGLAAQLVAIPVLAAALGRLLPVEAGIGAGLVLVAAVPGGTMSNVITYLGRGNIALSIAMTAVTTLAALATTPLILRIFIGPHLPPDFQMPVARVAYEIGVSLLIPLFTGMAIGARFPGWREPFSKWAIRASLLVIALMVVGAGGSGRLDARAYGLSAPIAIVALAIGAQALAVLASRTLRLPSADRLAVAVEVTVRNTNLALLIKASTFPAVAGVLDPIGDGMFFVALLYGGVAMLIAAPAVVLNRRATPAIALTAQRLDGDTPVAS